MKLGREISVCYSQLHSHKELHLFYILRQHQGKKGVVFVSTGKHLSYVQQLMGYFGYNRNDEISVCVSSSVPSATNVQAVQFIIFFQLPASLTQLHASTRQYQAHSGAPVYLLFHPFDVQLQLKLCKDDDRRKTQLKKMVAFVTAHQPTKILPSLSVLDSSITNAEKAYLTYYQPKTPTAALKLPGIGLGWIKDHWDKQTITLAHAHAQTPLPPAVVIGNGCPAGSYSQQQTPL